MNSSVISAIFKRNFISYFSNPTGYAFICVFVAMGSAAAFWPNEFFNANLANLDQLNKYLPWILLAFVPAITMSIWADERRLGTDELLLTIPASDFDVVIGKFLAAAAIYSVALLFSLLSNLLVLALMLGLPDVGLFLGNYFGYWIVGLAMISIGMAASFLTGNLTISFILGALFNLPLAFAGRFSISEQFRDFSRGVISFSSVAFFVSLIVVMLYLSMVFIGRRHWRSGGVGESMGLHYGVRFLSLLALIVGLNLLFSNYDWLRADVTVERLSSLSPKTRELLKNLDNEHPVKVEAFVSKTVPENYVQARSNLLTILGEVKAVGGKKLIVEVHDDLEPFSEEARRAEQQFGIRPQPVETRNRGARNQDEIFLAFAVTSGLEKVVVPFLGKGLPVEYELARSIATASQQKRKKIGVLMTDAKLYGGFDMQSMSSTRNEMIIDELSKQYDVAQVDATNPISGNYDVLLAVQPSSLGPQQMENFIAAVKNGQPTAIFEDPFPYFSQDQVPGTKQPKMPPGGANPFMQRQPPQPKGNIEPLWQALGVEFNGDNVVWQDYNPKPKAGGLITREWVFVDEGEGSKAPFNTQYPITTGLQALLFPYPGSIQGKNSSPLTFVDLISTGNSTGTVRQDQIIERSFMGPGRMNPELARLRKETGDRYVLAAWIHGDLKEDKTPMSDKDAADEVGGEAPSATPPGAADEEAMEEDAHDHADHDHADDDDHDHAHGKPPAIDPSIPNDPVHAGVRAKKGAQTAADAAAGMPAKRPINVMLVSDMDCLFSAFFALRARGEEADDEVTWDFDNVTFVLNSLDWLAGDERFIPIRNRRPKHHTLTKVTDANKEAQKQVDAALNKSNKEFNDAKAKEQKDFDEKIAAIQKRPNMDPRQMLTEVAIARQNGQRRLDTKVEQLKQARDKNIRAIERDLAAEVRRKQDAYKAWATLLPLIPPLLVGLVVFFNRRSNQREGVSKKRLR